MKTKSLIETNPYLRDAATREKLVTNSVVTSCGVEGVKVNFNQTTKVMDFKKSPSKQQASN